MELSWARSKVAVHELGDLHPNVNVEMHEDPNTWPAQAFAHPTIELSISLLIDERPPARVMAWWGADPQGNQHISRGS